jgi:hypothetical protein
VADEGIRASREKLRVLDGLSIEEIPSDRIALSLVHSIERIDVAISPIKWIEPRRFKLYGWGKNTWIARRPFVEICIAPLHSRKDLSVMQTNRRRSPGDRSRRRGRCSRPAVREPLGIHESISISQQDYEDAIALADRLRARWSEIEPRLVWSET